MNSDRCTVCGCSELNLIDGYYYCVECNTQNTNVRETIVEKTTLADGTFAITSKKSIVKIPKKTFTMSAEWYKWHAFNFIVFGLAEELEAVGAKPTLKMKLLWIWTRYIKKYQNKKELGLTGEVINITETTEGNEEENTCKLKETIQKKGRYTITEGSKRDIKLISRGLILAMLYVALNLDRSDIMMSQLFRYIREKRLNLTNLVRFVPDDINLKVIPQWLPFTTVTVHTPYAIRGLSLSLLRKLDLGTPIVPDLKRIVDDFLKELCLPNDLQHLVFSLMHINSCSFLDLDNRGKEYLTRVPDYECVVMSYILLAVKLCFGLDGDYEVRLSDAVDKINEEKELPKSHKFGKYSDPTNRLFSFREWCGYLQFRKIMLCKHCLYMAEQHSLDIDDYVHMEHMADRPQDKRQLTDEITMDLLKKIPLDTNIGVIPKEEFVPTSKPMSLYTEIITEHCQDPEVKYLLSEDFTQYSLKYATENLELSDKNTSENLVKGVSESRKIVNDQDILGNIPKKKKIDNKFVYVRNCENRNWMNTNPPTEEHITCTDQNTEGDARNDKDSDHGYDSEYTVNEKDSTDITDQGSTNITEKDSTNITESDLNNIPEKDITSNEEILESDEELGMIREEDEDKNIFDDSFEYLDIDEEKNNVRENDADDEENEEPAQPVHDNNDFDDNESDLSCTSFTNFNPATFDRDKVIRELILFACKKYKIVIPREYKGIRPSKRKIKTEIGEGPSCAKKPNRTNAAETKTHIFELLTDYYGYVDRDIFNRLQQEVNTAIQNAEEEANVTLIENNANQTNGTHNVTDNHDQTNTDVQNDDQQLETQNSETHIEGNNEIDENIEACLFEGEEMILDDLKPKSDPQFDEKMYDVKQLFVKIKAEEPDFEEVDAPELEEIIHRKILESKDEPVFAHLKSKREAMDDSDPNDDVPLSIIKEEMELFMKADQQEENLEDLIKKESVSEFKYWFRHYDKDFMDKSKDWHKKFEEELKENTPTSFYFVIRECASVLNCSTFQLYKKLQILEEAIILKS